MPEKAVRIPFDPEKELKVVGQYANFPPAGAEIGTIPKFPRLDTPITPKENFKRLLDKGEPLWMPASRDILMLNPRDVPDNRARAFSSDLHPLLLEERGGFDWFGIEWEFIPVAGGSMVKPGSPKVPDLCQWEKYIRFPDLDQIDWQAIADRNSSLFTPDRMVGMTQFNGLFERLISFVDFEAAALAMIDEDEQEAVHRLFSALCDFYEELFGIWKKYFNLELLTFHDDWGSQRAPFFSLDTCREMLVPYLSRLVEFCHSNNIYFNFHSCGKNEMLVPAMIESGADYWSPQPMNDSLMLLEKYGDQFIFGVSPKILPPDAPDEEVQKEAQAFVKKFKNYRRVICFISNPQPNMQKMYEYIYALTRESYNK